MDKLSILYSDDVIHLHEANIRAKGIAMHSRRMYNDVTLNEKIDKEFVNFLKKQAEIHESIQRELQEMIDCIIKHKLD